MLLRRVIGHVKAQNWTAVFLDFLIVVVGILLALQITEWNEARKERALEREYLQALDRDLKESLEYADDITESLREKRAAQAALADHIQGIRRLGPGELNRAILNGLFPLPKLDVSMPTYDELKTAGATPLLKDRTLRFALQELESRLEQVDQAEADKSEIFYRFSDPYLIKNFNLNAQGALTGNDADKSRPFVFAQQDAPADPSEALKTDEFKNVLIYRFNADGNQLQAIRELKKQYVKIEAIVRARLEKLGVESE